MTDEGHLDDTGARNAYAITRAFFGSLDVDQTCWRIATETSQALKPAQCVLFEYDHAANVLVATASSGPSVQSLVGQRLSLGDQRIPIETIRRHEEISGDLLFLHEQDHVALRRLLSMGAVLAEPLAVRNELIGLLLLVSTGQTEPFDEDTAALAHELAELAALALHNARLYRNCLRTQGRLEGMLARMSQVREGERKAFAATVHDDVLQAVVGAVYALEALRDVVKDEGLADFDHVLHMLRLSVEDARHIIWELRPAVLDGLGLAEALAVIADRIAVDGTAKVSAQLKTIDEISESASTAVYKVGREALLNAERHAHARTIEIRLAEVDSAEGPLLNLTVKDDGVGFDAGLARPAGHYGLLMMEEQAAAVGGVLHLESGVGRGTTVQLILPVSRFTHPSQRRRA